MINIFNQQLMKSLSLFVLSLLCFQILSAQDRITGRAFATRSEVIAQHAVLGLMEPTGSGMSGDLFAIVWDAKNKVFTHGASESRKDGQASGY